jgi:hypothetical protein
MFIFLSASIEFKVFTTIVNRAPIVIKKTTIYSSTLFEMHRVCAQIHTFKADTQPRTQPKPCGKTRATTAALMAANACYSVESATRGAAKRRPTTKAKAKGAAVCHSIVH